MGSKVKVVHANVAVLADLKEIIDAALAVSETGNIDLLVHNAATGDDCFLEDLTEDFYQAQTDVHLKGTSAHASTVIMTDIVPHQSS
tara:strand:+ start:521 stop:781 length:261 start_codon:yes stop_codon:yes gene_type:complete